MGDMAVSMLFRVVSNAAKFGFFRKMNTIPPFRLLHLRSKYIAMKNILCIASLFMLLVSCDDSQEQIKALKKETMDIHDEAMKDLADMNRVSRELKDYMVVALMTPEQSQQFFTVLADMKKAEDGMMSWMAEYKDPKGMPGQEAIAYMQDQKQKIAANRDDIRAALEAGKKLIPTPEEQ